MENQQPLLTPKNNGRKTLTLKKNQRLGGKPAVDQVYRTGRRRTHHPIMACCLRRTDHGPMRIAISVAKKCGGAVDRNAIRRRIREAHRQMQHQLPPGMDVLLVVRPHRRLAVRQYEEILGCVLR